MHQRRINPYQPIDLAPESPVDEAVPGEVGFHLTPSHLSHGEAQYLLQLHPSRLLLGSLAMIAGSCVAFFFALPHGGVVFMVVLLATLIAAAVFYLALVHRSKVIIRERLREFGLLAGAACAVALDSSELVLSTPNGQYRWPSYMIRTRRTSKGLLLFPQRHLYVLVPKQNDSPSAYDSLLRLGAGLRKNIGHDVPVDIG